MPQTVEKNLPEGVKMERYHVDFLGPLGADLTSSLGRCDCLESRRQVTPILFEGIQNANYQQ